MYRYYTITYENNIPISIEASNEKPSSTFDVTKAIIELATNLAQLGTIKYNKITVCGVKDGQ